MRCIIQSIKNHEKKLIVHKSPQQESNFEETLVLSSATKLNEKYSETHSSCPGVDQDDSGFDTSDSSDEKKKQLSAKVKSK